METATIAHLGRLRVRLNGVWLLLVTSALVLAGCDNGDVTATSSSLPTTTDTAATTTTGASLSDLAWSRVPDDDSVFGGPGFREMLSVTAGEPGLVAVGGAGSLDPVEQDAAVWTSPDGITWTRVPDTNEVLGGPGLQGMNSLTAGGPGLVAVGSDGANPAVWTSPDGIAWSKTTMDQDIGGMASVTVGGPGLVAVGGAGGVMRWKEAAVWTSTDGVTWLRVPHDEAVFGGTEGQLMISITVGGPGLVAVGQDGPIGEQDAAVWTSPDGLTWSRVPDSNGVFGGPGLQQMFEVTAGGMGLVAVGQVGTIEPFDMDAAVWTSPDGVTWSRVPNVENVFGDSESLQLMTSVTVAGNGLVAVGADIRFLFSGDGSHAPIWTSPDGITWSQETLDGEVGTMASVTVGGPGLVAVGQDRGHAAVWAGIARN